MPRGPTDLARTRRAYLLRQRGLPWQRIADLFGLTGKHSAATARKMVRVYRERLATGATLPKARMAYRRRERGEPWERIARGVGYASGRAAREMGRRYARRAGLPWPVRDAPGANLVHETH